MSADSFHPLSLDATLARIIAQQEANQATLLARLSVQDSELARISAELVAVKEQTTKTNGRVTKVEGTLATGKAKLAGVLLVLGTLGTVGSGLAWVIEHMLTKKP